MGKVLSPFWAGAVHQGRGVDLRRLRERAGSWDAVEAQAWALLAAEGLPAARIEAWLSTPELRTVGCALRLRDATYPRVLRQLRIPPPAVFVDGALDVLEEPGLAVVGTRRCTAYGRGVAFHLGRAAAEAGLVVVSGLARGVDAAAHRGTLGVGRTIAVVAHGLPFTAPRMHRRLRDQILEAGGAVITGFPDPWGPKPHMFPARNRWVVGLSQRVVVVEAPEKSGALITARMAAEEGRDVFAVPGPLRAPASAGCLALLREGADLLDDVDAFVADCTRRVVVPRETWLSWLYRGDPVEEVARRLSRPVTELLTHLTELELAGLVERLPGQRYGPGRRSTSTTSPTSA